jgi:hypothetical protein
VAIRGVARKCTPPDRPARGAAGMGTPRHEKERRAHDAATEGKRREHASTCEAGSRCVQASRGQGRAHTTQDRHKVPMARS